MQKQPHLQVRHHKRRRQNFKTKDPFLRGFFYFDRRQCVFAVFLQRFFNFPQHLDEIRAGAAAGIEHEHARIGQAVGNVQLLAQRGIHAGDLILHNLRRRVPHAQLLAQLGVERLQEGFVKILDGVRLQKLFKEDGAIHAVERGGRPVQRLHQTERAELGGRGHLLEQRLDHRHVQSPRGGFPIKIIFAPGIFLVPQHPGGKHAVEQRLDQRGAEEMFALFRLELHAERFFQRGADGVQRGQVAGLFHAGAGVARIRGEKKSDLAGIVQRRGVQQHALEIFLKAFAQLAGGLARLRGHDPKRFFVRRELKGFQPDRIALAAAFQEEKTPVIRHQRQAVMAHIIAHLLGFRHGLHLGVGALDLNDAARRLRNAQQRRFLIGVLELVGREQPAVRQPGTAVFHMNETADLGLERVADGVEQIGERRVAGSLANRRAGGTDGVQFFEISFQRIHFLI